MGGIVLRVIRNPSPWLYAKHRFMLRSHRMRLRSRHFLGRSRLAGELLEPRQVLAGLPLITEWVATNENGLRDEDGDRVDWIEIHNAGDAALDLNGWFLTDDGGDLDKWRFPAVTLGEQGYLLVYASGKDRVDPQRPLHANFQLDRDGEYLALVRPDGTTIAQDFGPAFPAVPANVALGLPQPALDTILVDAGRAARWWVPTAENGSEALGQAWIEPEFDDSAWTVGTADIGFDQQDDFTPYFATDVSESMFRVSSSVYLRSEFDLVVPDAVFSMLLRVRYDDGFVAYLNGVEVARRNAPEQVDWLAKSDGSHSDVAAVVYEDINLSDVTGLLRDGTNVLAVQALNGSTANNDFLFSPQLKIVQPGPIPSTSVRFIETPTPAWPNGELTYEGVIQTPDVQPARGVYRQPIEVTVRSTVPDATLIYTLDGSEPTPDHGQILPASSTATETIGRLDIARTSTLRVASYREGYLTTALATQTYLFPDDVSQQTFEATLAAGFPAAWLRTAADYGLDPDIVGPNDRFDGEFASQFVDSLLAVPTLSLVMDQGAMFDPETGLYNYPTRSGQEWERPTSVELIYPDGSRGFQVNAGIRIQGGASRDHSNSKKKSLRLEFRGEYGPTELKFPLFGEGASDEFDTLILRTNYNDSWVHTPDRTQYIRDEWMRRTQLAMGQVSAHGNFVHVYLNGFYWGLYNAVERPEASFSATYFGGQADEWDAVNVDTVVDGDSLAWRDVRVGSRAVNTADVAASNAALLALLGQRPDGSNDPDRETLLDLENYLDYMIANFFGGNTDWPHKNYYVARQRGPDSSGFKFYSWDAEKILDHGEGSTLTVNQTGAREGVAILYDALKKNAEFRLMFADRVQQHFFSGGALYVDPEHPDWDPEHAERNVPAARYAQLVEETELALIAESARWGDEKGRDVPFSLVEWRTMKDNILNRYLPQRSAIVLDQFRAAGLYPTLEAPELSQHGGVVPAGFVLTVQGPGVVYYTLDGSDPRQSPLGTAGIEATVAASAVAYQGPVSIPATAVLKARSFLDGQWSALTTATFTTDQSPLRISEIMYHPRRMTGDGGYGPEDFEYVELLNSSPSATLQLAGLRLADGIEFRFPEHELGPGQRAVVVANLAAFRQRYGDGPTVLGEYGTGPEATHLNNGGETLRLENSLGQALHELSYDDSWYPLTDGDGFSLEALEISALDAVWSQASQWHASLRRDGTPGLSNGDLDGDGQVTLPDLEAIRTQIRSQNSLFDVTGDGAVDSRDVVRLVRDSLSIAIGDVDLDGRFDSGDLIRLLQTGAYEQPASSDASWATGDWDGDGAFTSADLVLAMQAGGFADPANARPEFHPVAIDTLGARSAAGPTR